MKKVVKVVEVVKGNKVIRHVHVYDVSKEILWHSVVGVMDIYIPFHLLPGEYNWIINVALLHGIRHFIYKHYETYHHRHLQKQHHEEE